MPMRSSWYDSINGDRPYGSDSWAQMIGRIYTDGVFLVVGGELKVTETNPVTLGVSVAVGAGMAGGRYGELYDAPLALTLTAADPTNARIDTIVLRRNLDTAVRATEIVVRTGVAAVTPLVPTLQQDATIWEVPLANVRVNAAVTFVNNANVTDRRVAVLPFRSAINVLSSNQNILINGSMEYWTKGNGPIGVPPGNYMFQYSDGWLLHNGNTTGDSSVTKETATVDFSKAATKIVVNPGTGINTALTQRIEDVTQYRGRPLSFSARVVAPTGFSARIRIREQGPFTTVDTYGAYNVAQAGYQTMSATKLIRQDVTALEVSVAFALAGTYYVDNAMAVVGGEPVEYIPMPPADDQARGERYLQKIFINPSGYASTAGFGGTLYATVPYRRSMGGTPSATITTVGVDVNMSTIAGDTGMNYMRDYGGSYYATPAAIGMMRFARDIVLDWYVS